jgi:hypothetical protein
MTEHLCPDGYPAKSRTLGKYAWFYEMPGGIHIYFQQPGFNIIKVKISWTRLESAVNRYQVLKDQDK